MTNGEKKREIIFLLIIKLFSLLFSCCLSFCLEFEYPNRPKYEYVLFVPSGFWGGDPNCRGFWGGDPNSKPTQ